MTSNDTFHPSTPPLAAPLRVEPRPQQSPTSLDKLAGVMTRFHGCRHRIEVKGRVSAVEPDRVVVSGLSAAAQLGDLVALDVRGSTVHAEIIRVERDTVIAKSFGQDIGITLGTPAHLQPPLGIAVTPDVKGRILNAFGKPIDGLGPLSTAAERPVHGSPPAPMSRQPGNAAWPTGIMSIDVFTPLCLGQRIGIFAGSGVGKSTLLTMLRSAPIFDTVVVALIGERGWEVRHAFDGLSDTDRRRTIGVVATSDEPAMQRRLAALTATTVAEVFRDRGDRVLLVMDSITRFAQASREIGLAAGELPVARGHVPSVFANMARLLERAGPGTQNQGSISAIYSVLVDGDDQNDPIADAVRGTLDGHIVLSREVMREGRMPAIDLLGSVSRMQDMALSPQDVAMAARARQHLARLESNRDLMALSPREVAANAELQDTIRVVDALNRRLNQTPNDPSVDAPFQELAAILNASQAPDASVAHEPERPLEGRTLHL